MGEMKKTKLEQLHRQMIAEIQDYAIILLDEDGTILSWNAGAQKIKGYQEKDILGQNFRIFYTPEDRQAGLPEQLIELAKKRRSCPAHWKKNKKQWSDLLGQHSYHSPP